MADQGGNHLYSEAIRRFESLLALARDTDLREPTAMTLATASADARPQARTVLLKQVDETGFVFYTNRTSRKGQALAGNPVAALLFFWQPLMQQVKVEGSVEPVSDAEADAYWASRPRESQVGGWASEQSAPLASREAFEARMQAVREEYDGRDIPRPPHWSGFRVVPDRIEFWHEREFRQHERDCYWWTREMGWQWSLLNP
jgi:pyridoxamine 5'-phosphate oxidase